MTVSCLCVTIAGLWTILGCTMVLSSSRRPLIRLLPACVTIGISCLCVPAHAGLWIILGCTMAFGILCSAWSIYMHHYRKAKQREASDAASEGASGSSSR